MIMIITLGWPGIDAENLYGFPKTMISTFTYFYGEPQSHDAPMSRSGA